MKVFLSVASFRLAYGGPARSVSRLAVALAAGGIDIGVWAPDQSAADTTFLGKDSGVRRLHGNAADALKEFGMPDVIHDNGIWLPHNHALAGLAKMQGIARVVSTRGMLEPWAMNHKRWKKRLAWHLYQNRDLRSAAALHATSEAEVQGIRQLGLGVPVFPIPNGVDLPTLAVHDPKPDRTVRTALFVGRLYPVKGLPMLVDAWTRVRPPGWKMKLVGPDEAGHRSELEARVRAAGIEDNFEFTGPLEGDALQRAYEQADLFILPSYMESFGIVVAEALAHGIPVMTTHGAPWAGLQAEGCGWWTPVSVEGIAHALTDATSRSPQQLQAMGLRGRDWMQREFSWESVAEAIVRMYRKVAG